MKFLFGFAAIAAMCFLQTSAQEYNYNYMLAAPSPYGSAPSYSAPSSYGSPPAYKVSERFPRRFKTFNVSFIVHSRLHLTQLQATRPSLLTDPFTLDQPLATLTHPLHHPFNAQPTCCSHAHHQFHQFHAAQSLTLHRSPATQHHLQATLHQHLHHTVKKPDTIRTVNK